MTNKQVMDEIDARANFREAIAELNKKPCTCVPCPDCHGTARGFRQSNYESEPCDMCNGGIVEVCDRCREMRDLEEDEDDRRNAR